MNKVKCNLCNKENGIQSFYDVAGGMYDMPELKISFKFVCNKCWNILCEAKSDLTIIAVQYHRLYNQYNNYEHFLKCNTQMNDNKFYKSNPISRNGKPIYVGNRRKEIELLLQGTKD